MGPGFKFVCRAETRRLIWLLGIPFAAIMVVHYFELKYDSVFSSASFFRHNLTYTYDIRETSNTNDSVLMEEIHRRNEKQDRGPMIDFVSEQNGSLNGAFGLVNNRSTFENFVKESSTSTAAQEKAEDSELRTFFKGNADTNDSSVGNVQVQDTSLPSEKIESSDSDHESRLFSIPPSISSLNIASLTNVDTNSTTPVMSADLGTYALHKAATPVFTRDKNRPLQSKLTMSSKNSSLIDLISVRNKSKMPIMSISQMNDLLLQIRSSTHSMLPRWSSTVDQQLLDAKSQIENARMIKNDTGLHATLYRNGSMFKRSYGIMNKMLKVYVYKEGEKPIFHQSILEGVYASEGWFLKLLEANKQFVTEDPREAHLFYLPFSSQMLRLTLYVHNSHKRRNLIRYMKNYVEMLMVKYPFWNRAGGADHFLTACHDWAPDETRGHMLNCLRGLCNADIRRGFDIGKDVSIPTTYIRSAQNPLKDIGGEPPSQRPILAFFFGRLHGYVRPILLKYWENDPDMKIFSLIMPDESYIQHMKSSKYCICARGFGVNSPRVVESIYYECVPVIISDNYVPPFFEILNWESFTVFILEKDIPSLKKILLSISENKYLEMHKLVKEVQQHFLWHYKPVKYDMFHMILHSVWYNRVFRIKSA